MAPMSAGSQTNFGVPPPTMKVFTACSERFHPGGRGPLSDFRSAASSSA